MIKKCSVCACGLGGCVIPLSQRLCWYADDAASLHEHDGSIGLHGRLACEFGGALQRRQGCRQDRVLGLGDVFGAQVFSPHSRCTQAAISCNIRRPARMATASGAKGDKPAAIRSAFQLGVDEARAMRFMRQKGAGKSGFARAIGASDDDDARIVHAIFVHRPTAGQAPSGAPPAMAWARAWACCSALVVCVGQPLRCCSAIWPRAAIQAGLSLRQGM